MQKITPFLWFDHQAEQAMNLYVSIFKNSKIIELQRAPKGTPNVPADTVMSGTFQIEGIQYHAFNGGPYMQFSPAISLFVQCESQEEVDNYWQKLTANGGEGGRCGWLKDKFGISWQIIPKQLGEMLQDQDKEKSGRAMEAMMKMTKIDIKTLKAAFDGK